MTHKSQIHGGVFPKGLMTLQDIITDITLNSQIIKAGAIFTFTGLVRESSLFTDKPVASVEIEAFPEKASEVMNQICEELINKYHLIDVRIWHATGTFSLSEELVYVVIACSHREEGLTAMKEAIHLYKTKSPVWKKEIYTDGSTDWISGKNKI